MEREQSARNELASTWGADSLALPACMHAVDRKPQTSCLTSACMPMRSGAPGVRATAGSWTSRCPRPRLSSRCGCCWLSCGPMSATVRAIHMPHIASLPSTCPALHHCHANVLPGHHDTRQLHALGAGRQPHRPGALNSSGSCRPSLAGWPESWLETKFRLAGKQRATYRCLGRGVTTGTSAEKLTGRGASSNERVSFRLV